MRALGLMSGTSMDGIDAAIIESDGETIAAAGPSHHVPYDEAFRDRLRSVMGERGDVGGVTEEITDRHIEAVQQLISDAGDPEIDVIGFHGQTILHAPDRHRTVQIGDGDRLAAATGIDVVVDFRVADVEAGGEGAPFASLLHRALATDLEKPLAVLNLGGVGNVTWIGDGNGDDILAFDTGPANALIDDWMKATVGKPYDENGAFAATGTIDQTIVGTEMANAFFDRTPPKSLDRADFSADCVQGMAPADGAATLTALTIASVARAGDHLPSPPLRCLVTGGGRHNDTIMQGLSAALGIPVDPVEAAGWDGDALEAQAFAFLAIRSLKGLPLSVPGTTGVPQPLTGGRLCRAA